MGRSVTLQAGWGWGAGSPFTGVTHLEGAGRELHPDLLKAGLGGRPAPPPLSPPRILAAETTSQQERLQAIAVSSSYPSPGGGDLGSQGFPTLSLELMQLRSACWQFPTNENTEIPFIFRTQTLYPLCRWGN